MPDTPETNMLRRFENMKDESLKRLLAYHRKYTAAIEVVLKEREKGQ